MSSGWSIFVLLGTVLTMAWSAWLLISNRKKPSTGKRMDHEFDGIEEFDNPLPVWWVGLFIGTIVFGLGYVLYYPALGNVPGAGEWSSAKEWQYRSEKHEERFAPLYDELAALHVDELMQRPRAMQIGRRLFLNYCSTCHGFTAQGSPGFPNLTDEEWIWGSDFANIKKTILEGRTGNMPAWGQVLSDQQTTELVSFLHTLTGGTTQSQAAHPGKTSYTTYCVACHAADGRGNAALGAPNLGNSIWLYGGDDKSITDSIVNGRIGAMPAHAALLGEQKAHLLAAYIYSLNSGTSRPAAK